MPEEPGNTNRRRWDNSNQRLAIEGTEIHLTPTFLSPAECGLLKHLLKPRQAGRCPSPDDLQYVTEAQNRLPAQNWPTCGHGCVEELL
ncbi:hypothetical protein AALO_G00210840 [Alosa alosa]|uniref:Uncharacterized protein n=1 Tax=Alosa alosa TaxID=278164 RepID=A0AAV6G6N7_9TELE|nr:hypothetical protein AALO_G00210840 [Alosa alosa]